MLLVRLEEKAGQKLFELLILLLIIGQMKIELCLLVGSDIQLFYLGSESLTTLGPSRSGHDVEILFLGYWVGFAVHLINLNVVFVVDFAVSSHFLGEFQPVFEIMLAFAFEVEIGSADLLNFGVM